MYLLKSSGCWIKLFIGQHKIYSGKLSRWDEQPVFMGCLYSSSSYSTGQVVKCNTKFGRKAITDTNLVSLFSMREIQKKTKNKNYNSILMDLEQQKIH